MGIKEDILAERFVAPITHCITTRFVDDIKAGMRIKYNTRYFNILGTIKHHNNEALKMFVEEIE
jgi:SPP1 family predicted phage head-tail adaptor